MPSYLRLLSLSSVAVLLCAFQDTQLPQGGEGKSPANQEKPAKKPDSATIANLVKQLGSKDFAKREKATKALEGIGLPALDALRAAAKGKDLEFTQRATRLVTLIENGFDSLLADYRRYGLPMPPEDAKLVRWQSTARYFYSNGKVVPPAYFLGFLLEPATKDKPALLLAGAEKVRLNSPKIPLRSSRRNRNSPKTLMSFAGGVIPPSR